MSNQTQDPFEAAVQAQLQNQAPAQQATEDAAPDFDYAGKIKLSNNESDAIDIEEAIELVKNADINQGYKHQILQQIDQGTLSYQFAECIRRLKAAAASGGIYRGGQDGL